MEKVIYIKDGGMKVPYYYWDSYNSWEEAIFYAKKMREDRKGEFHLKWFILEAQEGAILPVPKVILYLNRKLRVL